MAIPSDLLFKSFEEAGKFMNSNDDINLLIDKRPLLAHYTSTAALEAMLRNKEIWFSNPLFMNDLGEIMSGIRLAAQAFDECLILHEGLLSIEQTQAAAIFFSDLMVNFEKRGAFNIYVFCLSEHNWRDKDGRLSMWRAYGGAGDGAALIFKTEKLRYNPDAPVYFAKIKYGPESERKGRALELMNQWWRALAYMDFHNPQVMEAALFRLMSEVKYFAITNKHSGFCEEDEWRVV